MITRTTRRAASRRRGPPSPVDRPSSQDARLVLAAHMAGMLAVAAGVVGLAVTAAVWLRTTLD
jgi:hypothetical protein